MFTLWLIAATHWMLLHGVENQSYWVNMEQVTTLRRPNPRDLEKGFVKGVQCIVTMNDGKFVSVTETCEVVYQLIATGK